MVVGGALEHREPGLQCRPRQPQDALDGRGVDRHPCGTQPTVKQDLRERAAKGVANDDWREVEFADDDSVVVDDLLDTEMLDARRVAAQLIDVAVHPRRGRALGSRAPRSGLSNAPSSRASSTTRGSGRWCWGRPGWRYFRRSWDSPYPHVLRGSTQVIDISQSRTRACARRSPPSPDPCISRPTRGRREAGVTS